jgi:hypothetical protein
LPARSRGFPAFESELPRRGPVLKSIAYEAYGSGAQPRLTKSAQVVRLRDFSGGNARHAVRAQRRGQTLAELRPNLSPN